MKTEVLKFKLNFFQKHKREIWPNLHTSNIFFILQTSNKRHDSIPAPPMAHSSCLKIEKKDVLYLTYQRLKNYKNY